jgi:hypothetical protein
MTFAAFLSRSPKAMPFEYGEARLRNANYVPALGNIHRDQAAITSIFPHGQLGAGRAPRLHRLLIGSILLSEPFKKIKNEVFYDRISHRRCQCYCAPRNRVKE